MGDEMEESEPVDLGQNAEESDMDDILGPAPLPPLGTPPTPQATPQNNAPQSMTQLGKKCPCLKRTNEGSHFIGQCFHPKQCWYLGKA